MPYGPPFTGAVTSSILTPLSNVTCPINGDTVEAIPAYLLQAYVDDISEELYI